MLNETPKRGPLRLDNFSSLSGSLPQEKDPVLGDPSLLRHGKDDLHKLGINEEARGFRQLQRVLEFERRTVR